MFGKSSKGVEICKLVKKLLKICHEWTDPDATGAYGLYGDHLKLRRPVLMREYPDLCDNLLRDIPGGNATIPVPMDTCDLISKEPPSHITILPSLFPYFSFAISSLIFK